MIKVATAKKIHVVYTDKNEANSNACGCSGFDDYSNFAECDKIKSSSKRLACEKKKRAEILGGGTISSLGTKQIDTSYNSSKSETLKDMSTSTPITDNKKKLWKSALNLFEKYKDSRGAEMAKEGLRKLVAKVKGQGEPIPQEVLDAAYGEDKPKISTLGWVGIGVGALAVIGLVVYAVKKGK